MYEWDDILIVGDSWCSEREYLNHWPNNLLFMLTDIPKGIPRGRGFPGCHWWSIRNQLLRDLRSKPPKVLILIHTDASRIPSDINRPFTIHSALKNAQNLNNPDNRSAYKAAADYYTHLYSANFHDWAEMRWFLELDDILSKEKIEKVMHLYCIDKHKEQKYTFKNGVTIAYPLIKYITPNTTKMTYPNHMTYENNEKMAEFLYNLIMNYPGDGFLYTEKPFEK